MRSILWWLALGVLLVSNVVTAMVSGVTSEQAMRHTPFSIPNGQKQTHQTHQTHQTNRHDSGVEPGVSEHRERNGVDLGGVFTREGLQIHWAGSESLDDRVRPKDVIQATIERLEAEQKTNLGSDSNARAMVLLMEAKAILDGSLFDSPHGPVIE